MSDNLSPETRSRTMSQIKSKDTLPELKVRKLLHKNGFRFRLHRKDLPGCPDIILPRYKTVIFINGCFWHQHPNCSRATMPKTNRKYWQEKLDKNVVRDRDNATAYEATQWQRVIIWECEINNLAALEAKLNRTLS